MKKIIFTIAFTFSMVINASAFRVYNSQVSDFKRITNKYYSCIVKLQSTEVEVLITKDLMALIKSNQVSLDLKWESKDNKGMRFYLIPTFKTNPK